MEAESVDLKHLIEEVHAHAADDAVTRLGAAVEVAASLDAVADHLVDHFVGEARTQGCSWSEIGAALGVSKQAAQQRFVPFDLGELSCHELDRALTPRAARALRQAHKEARRMRVRHVDTEQILLGLLRDPRALALKILDRMGIDRAAVEREVARLCVSKPPVPHPTVGTLTPAAVDALQRALREADGLHHNYVGTEHLLLGLLAERGLAQDAVFALGGDYRAARNVALDLLAGPELVVQRRGLKARLHR